MLGGRTTRKSDYVIIVLQCISRLHGLFEDSDQIDVRWRKASPDEASSSPSGDATTGDKITTLHGALTNRAAASTPQSLFVINLLSSMNLLVSRVKLTLVMT